METMRCIWCEKETATNKKLVNENLKYANKEHIFPEAVGGLKCLRVGKVCEDCNNRLGSKVDAYLKKSNFAFMLQYQNSSQIIGKPIGKPRKGKAKLRKEAEIYNIKGSDGLSIERDLDLFYSINFTNNYHGLHGDLSYNEKFSKAIHKCCLNAIYDTKDYSYIKNNFNELIEFINNPEYQNYNNWSYGINYFNYYTTIIDFEPYYYYIEKNDLIHGVVLIFPVAIIVVSPIANLLNSDFLKFVGDNYPIPEKKQGEEYSLFEHFNSLMQNDFRKSFGDKVKLYLVKKQINATTNLNDHFHLLTFCKICGQINPTGFQLLKKQILTGDNNRTINGFKNSWNQYSRNDLLLKGINLNSLNDIEIENIINNEGISYPVDNDVGQLNILRCEITCISCWNKIIFDAKDCFI